MKSRMKELTCVKLERYEDRATLRLEFGADNVHTLPFDRGASYLSVIAAMNAVAIEIRDSMRWEPTETTS